MLGLREQIGLALSEEQFHLFVDNYAYGFSSTQLTETFSPELVDVYGNIFRTKITEVGGIQQLEVLLNRNPATNLLLYFILKNVCQMREVKVSVLETESILDISDMATEAGLTNVVPTDPVGLFFYSQIMETHYGRFAHVLMQPLEHLVQKGGSRGCLAKAVLLMGFGVFTLIAIAYFT